MNKFLRTMTLLTFAAASGWAHAADLGASISSCAAVTSDADRLTCFDKLASELESQPEVTARQPGDDIGRTREREKKKEKIAAENYDVSIESCERSAASKRVSFKLTNGQIWRQKNSRWLSMRDCQGNAELKSGYFGYTLYIEAMNQSIGVIRAD